ncbi:MAG: WYL domain-containing protein [Actinobacteria bacterium]|nr:WYL domain-containing protein [Actinomycetota bacterium]
MTARRGPRPTSERLRRLLVMLPWLMERGEVPLAEMAERFDLTEEQLVKDIELVSMCGLPPFVDELIDVWIDEGVVSTGIPRVFTRPLRLTAPEGFALLASARVAMQMPGADADGALGRALRKLAEALGDDGVVVDTPAPPAAEAITAAADACERLRVSYWSAAADEPSAREITPRRVFLDRGRWYVVADDHRSGETRTFRIDRIMSCESTGVIDQPREVDVPDGENWFADAGLPTARLRLLAQAGWVIERYPTRSVTPDADALVVELTVANQRWLEALLLRLGPAARVLDPPEWTHLGADAARALLARYEAEGSEAS